MPWFVWLLIGLFLGTCLGCFTVALMVAASADDELIP